MTIELLLRDGVAGDDQVLRALAAERRRHVLAALADSETALSLADLATEVARRETDAEASDGVDGNADRVRVSLYHCHVPILTAADLVDYDDEAKRVALAENALTEAVADRLSPRTA